jgi:hypothetical protein
MTREETAQQSVLWVAYSRVQIKHFLFLALRKSIEQLCIETTHIKLEILMTTDADLIEKREKLKHRLMAGEYKTLVDVFLAWINRLIQKITRRSKPLLLWLITVILSFVVNLIFLGMVYITGDFIIIRHIAESFRIGYGLGVLSLISILIVPIVTIIVINPWVGSSFCGAITFWTLPNQYQACRHLKIGWRRYVIGDCIFS